MQAANINPFTILNPRSIIKQLIIETAKRAVPVIIIGAAGGYVTYRLVKAFRNRHQAKTTPPHETPDVESDVVEPEPPPKKPHRARRRKARPEPA